MSLNYQGAGLNLLTALQKASSFGRTIGLIGSPVMCHGAETLADILGLKVYKYIANSNDDIIGVINLMKEKKLMQWLADIHCCNKLIAMIYQRQ